MAKGWRRALPWSALVVCWCGWFGGGGWRERLLALPLRRRAVLWRWVGCGRDALWSGGGRVGVGLFAPLLAIPVLVSMLVATGRILVPPTTCCTPDNAVLRHAAMLLLIFS